MRDLIASMLLLPGVALFVIAAVGLQRFDDVLTRMHVATKPATLGLLLVLAGTALRMDSAGDITKLALIAGLQLITAPIGAHMIGRAAYRADPTVSPRMEIDELAGATAPDEPTRRDDSP